jgi:hypothetical protein
MRMTPRINTTNLRRLSKTEATQIPHELRLAWFVAKRGSPKETADRRNLNTIRCCKINHACLLACQDEVSESWNSSAGHAMLPVIIDATGWAILHITFALGMGKNVFDMGCRWTTAVARTRRGTQVERPRARLVDLCARQE